MKSLKAILILLIAGSVFTCSDFKRPANGRFFEVLVVMDSSQHQSALADSIRSSIGGFITTLPSYEERYDLTFFSIKNQEDLEYAKRAKNVVFAAPLNEKSIVADFLNSILDEKVKSNIKEDKINAIRLDDKWYANQWILLLSGSNQKAIANYISVNQAPIIESLNERERKRYVYDIYDRGRQVKIEDTLMTDYGWKMGIQHDYQKHLDNYGFVSFNRYMTDNNRWIWVWWQDDVNDLSFLNPEWVNAKRDSLLEDYIRGDRTQSYVTTEYKRDVISMTKTMNGRYTIQTHGTWKMVEDFMGGPFVNYTIYDEKQHRLYMIEFAQFAPRFPKRSFVRQFESMILTFETDSTWQTHIKPELK